MENIFEDIKKNKKETYIILDEISNQIKRVESFLQEHSINIEFTLKTEDGYYLSWEECESQKKFRLIFIEEVYNGDIPIITKRPLVESKIMIRVRLNKYIPIFLKKLNEFYLEMTKDLKSQINEAL